jgi:hypothetical protein
MIEHYRFLEDELRSLISSPGDWLSDTERQDVADFIDVAEYGLAYETLRDIVTQRNKTLSPEYHRRLVEVARRMGLSEDAWAALSAHVRI